MCLAVVVELKQFDGKNKSDLSMIEVEHAILEQAQKPISFVDLVNEIQQYMNKSDAEIRNQLPQFYTDLNDDGSFISLGENVWGMRTWYPYDSVDEEVNHPEDADDVKAPEIKRVNAFIDDDDDDDVIDYDEEDGSVSSINDDDDDDTSDAKQMPDLSKFSQHHMTLSDNGDTDLSADDDLDDGIEGDLSEFSDADDEDDHPEQ